MYDTLFFNVFVLEKTFLSEVTRVLVDNSASQNLQIGKIYRPEVRLRFLYCADNIHIGVISEKRIPRNKSLLIIIIRKSIPALTDSYAKTLLRVLIMALKLNTINSKII